MKREESLIGIAERLGIKFVEMSKEEAHGWGGRFAYKTDEDTWHCGYRSKESAAKGYFDSLDDGVGNVIKRLVDKINKLQMQGGKK